MAAKRPHHIPTIVVLVLGCLAGIPVFLNPPGEFLHISLFSRFLVAFGLPLTAAGIHMLFRSLWAHDTVRSGNGAFEATYSAIVFRVVLFVMILHGIVTALLLDVAGNRVLAAHRVLMSRAVVFLFGAVFIAVGNLLPRTRPNVAFGLRTRRTLSNARIWQQVHRASGYATVGFGLVTAITSLMLTNNGTGAAIISAAAGIAVAMVFVSYYRSASEVQP